MKSAIRPSRSDPDHDRRVQEIRDSAVVRQALGQTVQHRRLPDGEHQVILCGGQAFVGATLEEAIAAAKGAGK